MGRTWAYCFQGQFQTLGAGLHLLGWHKLMTSFDQCATLP